MRFHRALAAAALTLELVAAGAPAAQADNVDPSVDGCQFSQVTIDKPTITVGTSKTVTATVRAIATGCESQQYAFLDYGGVNYSGFFGPSESDPTYWVGTAEFDPADLSNSNAGTHRVTVNLDNGGTDHDQDLGIDLTLKRRVWMLDQQAPSKVKKSKSFGVYGILDVADWNLGLDVGLSKQKVQLQSKASGGKYKTIKTVTSRTGQQGGVVGAKVKIKKATCFRWVYPGSSTKAALTSDSNCVKIKK